LKRCTKGKDFVARFGGEEFSIILPQTDMKGGKIVAEQIRDAVSTGNLKNIKSGESYGTITMSIGIGQYRQDDLPNSLLQRADRALYLAKDGGRNRVEQAI
jgi:diguanylate cyclase